VGVRSPVPPVGIVRGGEGEDGGGGGSLSGIGMEDAMVQGLEDLKGMMSEQFREMAVSNRKEVDRVVMALQHESAKRSTLEARMHSQLLLQAETMVAMEVKLLRLEAKVEKREAAHRRKFGSLTQAAGATGGGLNVLPSSGAMNQLAASGSSLMSPPEQGNHRLTLPSISAIHPHHPHDTIDEEENDFETMEIEVTSTNHHNNHHHPYHNTHHNTHPQQQQQQHYGMRSSGSGSRVARPPNPTNIAVISSGASLASAVTATSFLDGEETHDVAAVVVGGDGSARSDYGDVEDEGVSEASTPTQGSRNFTGLESILLNPINSAGTPNNNNSNEDPGFSTRATRGETDGNSSLATSVTNTTFTSTVVTATTRGGDSINPRNTSQMTQDDNHDNNDDDGDDEGGGRRGEESSNVVDIATSSSQRISQEDVDSLFALSPSTAHAVRAVGGGGPERTPRSRSQSPLTVQSNVTPSIGPLSIASASVEPRSIISTAAIAPARSFRARRDAAARMLEGSMGSVGSGTGRPLANRVVSFTSSEVFSVPPEINEAGDSITVPEELDNLSDVADAFADRARLWRDEYEARLDAIQKRWSGE